VPDQAVVNASPLIFLARAGRLEFLQLAAPEILVPAAVATEIRQYDADDPAVQALESTPWLKMVEVPAVPPPIQAWDLGPGESSVLAYAMAHRPMDSPAVFHSAQYAHAIAPHTCGYGVE